MDSIETLLHRAKAGEQQAIEQLLLIYKPLIDRHSFVQNRIDEDLRQFITLRFLIAINIFKIS